MYSLLLPVIFSSITFFDKPTIYDNPFAYVRSPEVGLSINRTKYEGKDVEYLEGLIGKSFAIATLSLDRVRLQLGAEAGAWLVLGYQDGAFPLITQDYYFSIPIFFRYKLISGALKFNHISSHMGDGVDILVNDAALEKKVAAIEKKEDVEIFLTKPKGYSRDYISFEIAREYQIESVSGKTYFHVGYLHKVVPEDAKRWFVGMGTELHYGIFYYAQDIRYNQDTDSLDYSAQAGIMDFGWNLQPRLAITAYNGSDRKGQFFGRTNRQIGIGLFFR